MDFALLAKLLEPLPPGIGGGAATQAARRARGQVFTPPTLAEAVVGLIAAALPPRPRLLDPACGDGAFLRAARAVVPGATVVGVERDPQVARAARAGAPGATVRVGEALLGRARVPKVDAVIGNPPYVRSIRLRASDPALWAALRGRFAATSFGEWDLYGAFLEKSVDWLAGDGRVALIVPSRWLTARWAGPLRAHLAARQAVVAVIELGAAQLFANATTYASIAILGGAAQPGARPIHRHGAAGWRTDALDLARLGDAPWIAPAPPRRARGPASLTLGEIAVIAKGAGTTGDPVFVLPDARRDGRWLRAGDVVIEAAAARPCLRGRDVGAAPTAWCVLPYVDGALVPWAEVQARWPKAAAYLAARRALLEARERGRFVGDRFHAFGRPQNLRFHLDPAPKVVIPDVVRTPRAWIDRGGALVLDSAYAVRPRPDAPARWQDVERLHALFASPALAAWLDAASVPLRGGYRRMKTAYLAPMPLP